MEIEKLTMYHISRETHWKVGDVIVAGERDNPFWEMCKNPPLAFSVNGQELSIFEVTSNTISIDVSQQNIDYLYEKLKSITNEFSLFVRETVLEDYRKNNHPDLPSRQKCLWVSEEKDLPNWDKLITSNAPRFLLTLELDGTLFCADEQWIHADTLSSVEFLDRAQHYWNGEMSSSPTKEYLFYGTATIKDVQVIT